MPKSKSFRARVFRFGKVQTKILAQGVSPEGKTRIIIECDEDVDVPSVGLVPAKQKLLLEGARIQGQEISCDGQVRRTFLTDLTPVGQ